MRLKLTALCSFFVCTAALGQGTIADYTNAKDIKEASTKVYGIPQQIVWSPDGNSFLYLVQENGRSNAAYIIDALTQEKKFIDVEAISKQMAKDVKLLTTRDRELKVLNGNEIEFVVDGVKWQWIISENRLVNKGHITAPSRNADGAGRYWGARGDDSKGDAVDSPNKKYTAYIKNSNVFVRAKDAGSSEKQLTFDGSPGEFYAARIQWSGDSKKLAVLKVRKAEVRQLTLLESSPADQFQPKLQTRDYPKPGDALAQYYPTVVDIESGQLFTVNPTSVNNQFSVSNVSWLNDNSAITFEFNKRGHQQYAILALDAVTGKTDTVLIEHSNTFVDYSGKKFRFDNEPAKEIIWASERDGWNHLYVFDAKTGALKNQITKGNWVVRRVVDVDTAARRIIFEASGMKKGEDPYLIRYYTVGFDGKNLKELTPETANHQANFNPSKSMFVDTYSLANKAPVSVLRSTKDGKIIMPLVEADISALEATGWRAPEIFSAPGRDGKTDIWGLIIRPRNYDPQKKYPVIEYIYAGPHSSFVPKSFYANPSGMYELAELGFIVVQIDGMGTSNRSKAFHDVAWKNLKDAGFPDRIAWMKAAAKKDPAMDIERVGIYGTSAGGQSSTGGVLFHPEFYKVAVSSCGCHDNRMDKIWWNEQWMGWPIGKEYAECSNIDNAYRLQGKLMLIVGELDDNVDPASTYQLVNALIKNGKEHEFIMVPGMGHSSGGDYGEKKRRDFFVKNLLGVSPPLWNQY